MSITGVTGAVPFPPLTPSHSPTSSGGTSAASTPAQQIAAGNHHHHPPINGGGTPPGPGAPHPAPGSGTAGVDRVA